jgi:uncharacterized membrane protein YphA (DoxX/SURF4 family)
MKKLLYWPGHAWLSLPLRWYLGYVFLSACIHKIADPGSFAVDVATYDILPLSLVNLVAIALPWTELAAGLLLVVGFRTRAAAWMISGMMLMFLIALVIALNAGLDISCGCFASQGVQHDDPISMETVTRDIGWLTISLYVVLFDHNAIGVDRILAKYREIQA